jgi:hypothetical protein
MNGVARTALAAGLLLGLLPAISAGAELGPAVPTDKKVLAFACNVVEPSYLREYVQELEKLPLDGLMIPVYADDWQGRRTSQEDLWFGGRKYKREHFTEALADLKAIRFRRFTDNFIYTSSQVRGIDPSWGAREAYQAVDWFNSRWSGVASNFAVAAWIAREAGFKGLAIDTECYEALGGPWSNPFSYEGYRKAYGGVPPHTFAECVEQVRKRGKEFAQAIVRVYPDIALFFIHDTGWTGDEVYGLLGPFVDGILAGCGDKATVVDGVEPGYPLIAPSEFAELRKAAETGGRAKSVDPELHRKKMTYACAIWVDHSPDSFGGWHTDPGDLDKNYRSPEAFEQTLYGALQVADTYVWLYMGHANVWFNPTERPRPQNNICKLCPHRSVPQPYLDALANCRKPHALNWAPPVAGGRFLYVDDVVLVEGPTVTAAAPNLLNNPGFEAWGKAADQAPDGWYVNLDEPVIQRQDAIVRSGKYAVRLTSDVSSKQVLLETQQAIPAAQYAGKTITMGVWARADMPEMKGAADLQILDLVNGSYDVATSLDALPADRQWHFITATKTIRPGATGNLRVRIAANIPYLPGVD